MTASANNSAGSGRGRYDGLDLFRPLSAFGVVLIHLPRLFDVASAPAFAVVIRLRDGAFPIIILTSFFVITRSLLANPGRTFAQFASNRFMRLAVPCVVWSALYWLAWEVVGPLRHGQPASWPPPSRVLSGYAHLWFLQFLFLGSIITYPAVRIVVRQMRATRGAAWIWPAACLAAAAGYWMWGRPFLAAHVAAAWDDQDDPSLRVAIRQCIAYAKYPVLGIAAALMAGTIDAWYRRPAFKAATLVVAASACALHVMAVAPVVSRAFYSMAVFIALLRPWPPGVLDWLRPMARYSYPIYILHPAVAKVVASVLPWWSVRPSIAGLLAGGVAVFTLSGAAAVLLRSVVRVEWFLPLVPVRERRARAGLQ